MAAAGIEQALSRGLGAVQVSQQHSQDQAGGQLENATRPDKKPFMAEQLRQQDFNIEEAFAEFSVLHGVKSRLHQFGYEFFDAQARGFSLDPGCPGRTGLCRGATGLARRPYLECARSKLQPQLTSLPVERDGMVVIPQVGAIPVGGQTFSQAERTIRC